MLKLKLEFLINSSVQILQPADPLILLLVEILQPFSDAATIGVPYKKLFLKFFRCSQENSCCGVSF